VNHDPWLQSWASAIAAAAANHPVLEIGCGPGHDTAVLVGMGLDVYAFDLSKEEAAKAAVAAPRAQVSAQSVLDPFPLEGQGIGVVVASLSLHYFTWPQTAALAERIRTTLRVGGLFLARFNSDQDVHYGAVGHQELEPGLYSVNGQPKRFFAERDLDALFGSGWRLLSKKHMVTRKYQHPKALWEVAVARAA